MFGLIKKLIKRYLHSRGENYTRKWIGQRTKDRFQRIPSNQGNKMTSEENKQMHEFWDRYISVNPIFHQFYTKATGKFNKLYIPDDIHFIRIDKYFNDWSRAKYIDNKTLYLNLFSNFRQPTTIATRRNGFWLNKDNQILSHDDYIFYFKSQRNFFVKEAEMSYGGKGVEFVSFPEEDKLNDIYFRKGRDIVIQKSINQCEELAILNPSSVNTIRVMTLLRNDGSVKICSSILRMGIGKSKVDNASSGGITVGILPSGRLKDVAYANDGRRFFYHPTTGINFGTVVIPGFNNILELLKIEAVKIPHFRLVSWDIAVDQDKEPVLIEANLCDGELDFHQLNNGPIFGDDTEEILKEVFGK